MSTAKAFKSGNCQAVSLTMASQVDASEAEIFRRGDEVDLCSRVKTVADAVSILSRLSPHFMQGGRDQGPSQMRNNRTNSRELRKS
jgi:virulence-associated protein VagC